MGRKTILDGKAVAEKTSFKRGGNNSGLKSWQGYAFAAVVTAATLGLRLALTSQLAGRPTLVVFMVPIMLSAYVGGVRAGLLATLLCYLGTSYYLLPPYQSFRVASVVDRWDIFFLILAGVVISLLNEGLHRARRRADIAMDDLQSRVALVKMEVLQTAIFNSANFSCIATDAKGVIQLFNVGAERMLGYQTADVVNKITPADLHDPQEVIARAKALSQELGTTIAPGFEALVFKAARGIEDVYELTKIRKDGSRFPAVVSVTALRDAQDGIIGYLLIGTDNTAHKQAEEDRKRFFALSQDVLCILGFDGFFKDLNPAWEKTLGFPKAELLSTPFIEFVHPDDRQATLAEAEKVCGGKSLTAFENRYRCQDGSYRWFQWSVTPVIESRVMYGVARDVTGRKQAETASILLTAIVDSSNDAIIGKDLNGIITSWNKGAERIFGYTAGEMAGTSIMRLIPTERQAEENQILGKIKQGESLEHVETIRQTKDGRLINVSVTVSPIVNSTGTVTGVSKIARDITYRKLAEEQLKRSHKDVNDLKAALDEHAIVATTDPQGKITYVNDKFCAIAKYSRGELIGQDHRVINSGFHSKEFFRDLWSIITHGQVWHGEIKNKAKDGSFYWVGTTIVPFLSEDGQPRQYVAIRADITERKRAETALQESEERFRTLSNSMPQLAWIARADGFIFWYNQRWYEYTGTQLEQMEGLGWQSVHDPKVLPKVMENWSAALASRQPFEMEFPLRGADGQFRAFLTRVQPLKNSAGEVTQWFGTNTDVETLKQTEEKVQRLNDELEQRVSERTAQLEAANQELEAFSYSVSHDLRAPLRGVDGYIRMLKEDCGGQLDAEGIRLLNVVSSEAKRMGHLIDDLLKFSRLGREQMKRSPVDMTALARDAFENLTRAAPESAPRFELKPLPLAQGDLGMLRQVFANLLGNAVKFTRNQAVPVIEVGVSEADGEIAYYVKDNGVGFDEKYGHKLFGVFQRLHSEEEFEGTGVGLALVQRVIQRHGGKVWAQGKPNEGAIFQFTVPRRKNPANE